MVVPPTVLQSHVPGPSRRSVHVILASIAPGSLTMSGKPRRDPASRQTTSTPRRASSWATVAPPAPEPMTTATPSSESS